MAADCEKGGNMAQRVSGINVRRRRVATKQQREVIRKEEIEKLKEVGIELL